MNEEIISFEVYETVGIGRGPVGLEPIFRAIDEQKVTEQELQDCIAIYRQDKLNDEPLLGIFSRLVRMLMPHRNFRFDCPEDVVSEAAELCVRKVDRYPEKAKAKAFNFFATIIGCYLSQAKRTQQNRLKLKGK